MSIRVALLSSLVLAVTGLSAVPVHAAIDHDAPGQFAIVNGDTVDDREYPEVVRLDIETYNHQYASCGGTFLDDRWILTAAHCFEDSKEGAKTLVNTFFDQDEQGKTITRTIRADAYFAHPFFATDYATGKDTKGQYDVALVRMREPIKQLSGKPVPVTTLPEAGEAIPRSGNAIVVGRGAYKWIKDLKNPPLGTYEASPNQLRQAVVPLLDTCHSDVQLCAQESFYYKEVPDSATNDDLHDSRYRKPSSCYGDSGGPLYIKVDGKRQQVGLVSHHRVTTGNRIFFEDDVCGRATVWYTSLSYVRPWIELIKQKNPRVGERLPRITLPKPPYAPPKPKPQPEPQPTQPAPPPAPVPPQVGGPVPPAPPASPAPPAPPAPPSAPVPPVSPAPPSATPVPPAPRAPQDPKATVIPSYPGDADILRRIPVISRTNAPGTTKATTWTINGGDITQGSDISVGVARLRDHLNTHELAQGANATSSSNARKIALLASEEGMADALASGPLQRHAPLFLTQAGALEPGVLAEIKRQRINEVWLLGGERALHPVVQETLAREGLLTKRIGGQTRLETAALMHNAWQVLNPKGEQETFIARAFGDAESPSRAWADALALGALGATKNSPILLTETASLSLVTASHIKPASRVALVGGTAAINPRVAEQVSQITGKAPERFAGDNRAHTAVKLSSQFSNAKRLLVIDGQREDAWQTGFVIAGLAKELNAPVVLSMGDELPEETKAAIKQVGAANVVCIANATVCAKVNALGSK